MIVRSLDQSVLYAVQELSASDFEPWHTHVVGMRLSFPLRTHLPRSLGACDFLYGRRCHGARCMGKSHGQAAAGGAVQLRVDGGALLHARKVAVL